MPTPEEAFRIAYTVSIDTRLVLYWTDNGPVQLPHELLAHPLRLAEARRGLRYTPLWLRIAHTVAEQMGLDEEIREGLARWFSKKPPACRVG